MTFSISVLVSTRDSHIKADSEAEWTDMGRGLIPGTDMKLFMSLSIYHIFYIYFFQTLTFILQKRSLK
jgi:hypothetical protein